ncbi:preprotein translocase subunit YajC [Fischerella sp. PCC 9605]|uniref:preprotein translocase subunit YajC n=1 Tax=Fischerella sp. PCC 9605 TaxID=1173024 RepID=UPI000478B374|nr:preprotein translocase subunit YajC [Fischerella sp. PCC 9605]
MSNEFKRGDRVVVKPFFGGLFNRYNEQHGKVVSINGNQVKVEFDDKEYGTQDISGDILSKESFEPHEVNAEIENVGKHFQEVFPKLSGTMGEQMKKELPNHLGYLKNAQASNDKSSVLIESNYLLGSLQVIRNTESELKDWGEEVEVSLDKIQWWAKNL